MKKEDLFKLLADIDETSVEEAQHFHTEDKSKRKNRGFYGMLAALILLVVIGIPVLGNITRRTTVMRVLAAGPEEVGKGMSADEFLRSEDGARWREAYEQSDKQVPPSRKTRAYGAALMKEVLAAGDENTVCSPFNTYLAFAMLAETCEGNTRKQILDMLGAEDIETLRKTANALWEANSCNAPVLQSLPANSLWLSNDVTFNETTLKTLAEQYHASSFRGKTGSDKMDKALQDWTNGATGGLLADYVKDLKTSPDTVMALLSTLYYKTSWNMPFSEQATDPGIFHGTKGDTSVRMMHTVVNGLLQTDRFSAVRLLLTGGCGSVVFCLPAEGTDVNALLNDPSVLQLTDPEDCSLENASVNLSLPKFKISAKTDLLPVLEALGVTDALDPAKADFSPLTAEKTALAVGRAEHAATVEIDESGVTGAAYTMIDLEMGEFAPADPISLTFDRPFLFMVAGSDGSILFAGAVRNITE